MSSQPWSAWYKTWRWQKLRERHLRAYPLCVMCEAEGRVTEAKVCDHIEPHKGDPEKFWNGPFQSLCKAHHDSDKQALEKSGRRKVQIGEDGYPIEGSRHPLMPYGNEKNSHPWGGNVTNGRGEGCSKNEQRDQDRPLNSFFINVQKKSGTQLKAKMAQRGRKSQAELMTPAQVASVSSDSRLRPPVHITDAERMVWAEVVNDQPASAFSPTHSPLLEQYCRHVVQARLLADEIMNFDRSWLADDDGLKRYDRLLAMQEREGRAASSLATRLRITRQATADPKTVGRANGRQAKSRKPWELVDG